MKHKKKKKKEQLSEPSLFKGRLSSRLTAFSRQSGEGTTPQARLFSVKLHVMETEEVFTVPECYHNLTIKNLKSRLELLVGIPVNFMRLQYLDEVDLNEDSTFRNNDIILGGTLTLRIWSEDAWGHLVTAAASGIKEMLADVGGISTSVFNTASARRMGPEKRNEWLAYRTFVALFITVRRGYLDAVELLLQNGVDLKLKTPLGRTVLHVAVISGHIACVDLLLSYGAKITEEDYEGYTPVDLARQWGQKECERRLFQFQWKSRRGVSRTKLD
nr:PREDICTED: ankyrin repeat domain-containing protein 60 [Anolis carolinensis]|eukprot:XP_003223785.1 PREDICTED: ankyrin repeat domain-containing protein 60 [Anolis carolinensis]